MKPKNRLTAVEIAERAAQLTMPGCEARIDPAKIKASKTQDAPDDLPLFRRD